MAALRRKTREMLSAASRRSGRKLPAGQSVPPPTAGRPRDPCFEGALAALRTELEVHRCRVVETEALIARLAAYLGAEEFPSDTLINTAPTHSRRRRRGRPPTDAGAAQRIKKRDAMRRRRAKIKAEAAATPEKPKAKLNPQKAAETAAAKPAPPEANGKRKRRPKSTGGKKNLGVKAEISGWTTDADGNVCRSLVAEGERVPLKDERPHAT